MGQTPTRSLDREVRHTRPDIPLVKYQPDQINGATYRAKTSCPAHIDQALFLSQLIVQAEAAGINEGEGQGDTCTLPHTSMAQLNLNRQIRKIKCLTDFTKKHKKKKGECKIYIICFHI